MNPFNAWSKLEPEDRTTDALLRTLDFDFFEVLDSVTIARSRKHIEKYYNTAEIGKFPERLKPISKRPNLTDLNSAINYNQIYEQLMMLSLCIYTPSNYIFPSKLEKYIDMSHHKGTNLTQIGREQGIQRLMSINLLKRLESSVYSFNLTLKRIHELIKDIFPQKWQSNYVISETSEAMKEKIEHIGNKIPFEKKLNIVAGNEYYAKKKAEYLKSSIQIVRDLGESSKDDWSPDDIIRRDGEIVDHVVDIFNDWSGRYNENDATSPKQSSLTPEQIQKALELAAQGKL